mmetsp:Transcript_14471/g.25567  ORF Transcript_14471/g.25567 Transcript_14471/m.25567 type:complete len:250 (+) Transcript_14471:1029-1778(+)
MLASHRFLCSGVALRGSQMPGTGRLVPLLTNLLPFSRASGCGKRPRRIGLPGMPQGCCRLPRCASLMTLVWKGCGNVRGATQRLWMPRGNGLRKKWSSAPVLRQSLRSAKRTLQLGSRRRRRKRVFRNPPPGGNREVAMRLKSRHPIERLPQRMLRSQPGMYRPLCRMGPVIVGDPVTAAPALPLECPSLPNCLFIKHELLEMDWRRRLSCQMEMAVMMGRSCQMTGKLRLSSRSLRCLRRVSLVDHVR